MKRIGLFGGLFDPVHAGHCRVAEYALTGLSLDRLYIIPANRPPHKQPPALPARDRLKLLKAAFAGMSRVMVSGVDIGRGGLSYAFETAEHFRKKTAGELYFIVGTDNLAQIRKWKYPRRIFASATVVAVGRPGSRNARTPSFFGKKILRLNPPPLDISSTVLREKLKRGEPVEAWIPLPALRMIRKNGWYR